MLGKLLAPTIEEFIREHDYATLKVELADLDAIDLADLIQDVEGSHTMVIFRLLSKEKAADVFEYLDIDHQKELLRSLSKESVKHILEEMSVDDRTALLDELPPQVASQLIELLSHEDRQLAQTILNFPEDSVGRLITPDYVSLSADMTAAQALEKIRLFGQDKETVYACYVIGEKRRLLGVVSLRRLVTSPLDAKVADLQVENFVSLTSGTEQEEAVDVFRRYDLIALPVLDSEGNMLGIVTFDDIMDVAEEEFREDMDRMAAVVPGAVDKGYLDEHVLSSVRRRVPWLVALLLVEGVAVLILTRYDGLLDLHIALSFFLPALIATGGNTGTQSASMVIRAIATGEVVLKDIWRIASRAVVGGLVLAVLLGLFAFLMAMAIRRDSAIGLCVALGLAAVVIMSNIAGSVLPLILKRAGLDPALMSSPFISTLVDIFGLVIYMEISRAILVAP